MAAHLILASMVYPELDNMILNDDVDSVGDVRGWMKRMRDSEKDHRMAIDGCLGFLQTTQQKKKGIYRLLCFLHSKRFTVVHYKVTT